MLKLLPVVLFLLAIAGGLIYFRYFKASNIENPTTSPVAELENSPASAAQELPSALPTPPPSLLPSPSAIPDNNTASLDTRLKVAEAAVAELKARVSSLEKASPTTTASTPKSPLYIPLGSGGVNSDSNWSSIATFEITLDPGDYAGYSDMQLEVNFRLPSLVGTGYARLYNFTDSSVTSAELSTTSGTYVWASTAGFKLASGKKVYKLQTKSSAGKDVEVQSARIKVNF